MIGLVYLCLSSTDYIMLINILNIHLFCLQFGGGMTLTRGSFTYSSGEEYTGEWKEGKHFLTLCNYFCILRIFIFHKWGRSSRVSNAVLLFITYFLFVKSTITFLLHIS